MLGGAVPQDRQADLLPFRALRDGLACFLQDLEIIEVLPSFHMRFTVQKMCGGTVTRAPVAEEWNPLPMSVPQISKRGASPDSLDAAQLLDSM
jgi:hypothetical protein